MHNIVRKTVPNVLMPSLRSRVWDCITGSARSFCRNYLTGQRYIGGHTVPDRSPYCMSKKYSDSFYIVSNYIKRVTTSWTYISRQINQWRGFRHFFGSDPAEEKTSFRIRPGFGWKKNIYISSRDKIRYKNIWNWSKRYPYLQVGSGSAEKK